MRLKCTLSYDGSNYSGWQYQPHAISVQQTIEAALERIHKQPIKICAAGRTDAHVHAIGQVIHFDTFRDMTPPKWLQALNSSVPADIHFSKVEIVSDNFHARYNVVCKIYEYRFNFTSYNVHRAKYCVHLNYDVDIEAMRDASQIFIGKHDFSSFCVNPIKVKPNQVREIESITIHNELDEWIITYKGKGFLRYMIRMLSASLIDVGLGRLDKAELKSWLDQKDKDVCRLNGEPCGLYLKEVIYKETTPSS